jgi:two-component system nitrogen regulation sensor histidine kinase NtrY
LGLREHRFTDAWKNMAFRRFSVLLLGRLLFVGLSLLATVWLMLQPGYHGVTAIAAIALALSIAELWRHISRTNMEVARFLSAARHADFSQRFSFENVGSGFEPLGNTFTEILDRFRSRQTERESELRHMRALIEHVPVPLLSVHGNQSITLHNNAARRLFGAVQVTRLQDLRQLGMDLHNAIEDAVPGRRELVVFTVEGVEHKLTLATTEIIVGAEKERLVSLQDIQSELDTTQAQAWQDLVRVLTHEIMNSITPVTSLAATASDLANDMLQGADKDSAMSEDLTDLRDAVATVARRSDSLTQFVNSYRQLTRLAPPEKKRIQLADLFAAVGRLAEAESPPDFPSLTQRVEPAGLDVFADRDLLEPVLLNLLRNAWQVTQGIDNPEVELLGRLNRRGNVVIEVSDNGTGVPDDLSRKIFVPFFTTKTGGSGVGLALARQVMIAHGGFITLGESESGGARFTLTF